MDGYWIAKGHLDLDLGFFEKTNDILICPFEDSAPPTLAFEESRSAKLELTAVVFNEDDEIPCEYFIAGNLQYLDSEVYVNAGKVVGVYVEGPEVRYSILKLGRLVTPGTILELHKPMNLLKQLKKMV